MTRSQLKRRYNLAVAAALMLGFAAGYWLRQPGRSVAVARTAGRRQYESDYAGCRERYQQLMRDFSWGSFVRTDYNDVLAELKAAIREQPGYLPYRSLQSRVYEDLAAQCTAGRVEAAALPGIAAAVGARSNASAAQIADRARALAAQVWEEAGSQPLCTDVARYGDQWRVLREQHLGALKAQRQFRIATTPEGRLDLALALDRFGITRDHDRYVNDFSSTPQGLTFEEKHMPDLIQCPQHPTIAFEFPCLTYISAETGGTVREDVDFFRTALAVDAQTLDIEDVPLRAVHVLACNVTPEGRVVQGALQLEYSGGRQEALPMKVGPWRQSPELLRDAAQRRELDAAHRDTELHQCNGQELEMVSYPVYLYHVVVPVRSPAPVDKLAFPRHDPSSVGLEDPGIADIRVVAVTLEPART